MGNAGALADSSDQYHWMAAPVQSPSNIQTVESQNLPVSSVSITGAQGQRISASAVLTNCSIASYFTKEITTKRVCVVILNF